MQKMLESMPNKFWPEKGLFWGAPCNSAKMACLALFTKYFVPEKNQQFLSGIFSFAKRPGSLRVNPNSPPPLSVKTAYKVLQ